MPDTDNQTAAVASEPTFEARLTRGLRYVLGGKHYLKGEVYKIDDATKAKLEEKAVDPLTIEGDYDENGDPAVDYRQKFTFNRIGEAPAAPARRRVRAPAAA